MDAATWLGVAFAQDSRAAAETRWLTTGEVITASPLVVDVDGAATGASLVTGDSYAGAAGDVVLVGVLRGSFAAVRYVVFGKITPGVTP